MGLLTLGPPGERKRRRGGLGRHVLLYGLLVLALASASCGGPKESTKPLGASGEWLEFSGSWNATGSRQTIPLGPDRRASVLRLSGTMLLAGTNRPGAGFRSEVVALVDSATGLVGRSVWTDERGDQVFSELQGEGTATNNKLRGSFLGGTGRFAGVTGTYEFSWQFVMESEEGTVHGRAVGLTGRVRTGPEAGDQPK
jgi:hypothetical protein